VSLPADNTGGPGAGRVSILSGVDGSVIRTFLGSQAGERFGWSLAGLADLNGDGVSEFIIGTYYLLSDDNEVFVLSGADGVVIYEFLVPATGPTRCAALGDIDGDGDEDGAFGIGTAIEAFSGKDGSILRTFDEDASFPGLLIGLHRAGDVDGDGVPDVLVSRLDGCEKLSGWPGGYLSGLVRVYSGRTGIPIYTTQHDEKPCNNSWGVASAIGDVDLDGRADVIVSDAEDYYCFPFICNGRGMARLLGGTTCGSWHNYGLGWKGHRLPDLHIDTVPLICQTITLTLESSTYVATPGVLFLGAVVASIPTAWDGTLHLLPAIAIPVMIPGAMLTVPALIPCDPLSAV
jgi:hypothetical protein